jgi:hypothetical protein
MAVGRSSHSCPREVWCRFLRIPVMGMACVAWAGLAFAQPSPGTTTGVAGTAIGLLPAPADQADDAGNAPRTLASSVTLLSFVLATARSRRPCGDNRGPDSKT